MSENNPSPVEGVDDSEVDDSSVEDSKHGESNEAPLEEGSSGQAADDDGPGSDPDHADSTATQPEPSHEAGSEDEGLDSLFLSPEDSESEVIEEAAKPEVAPGNARIGELESALESVTQERDDFKNKMVRVAADFENFRKRATREKQELRKFGIDRVVLELLPVIDNLERALSHTTEEDKAGGVVDGVRMVYKQFVSALQKHGVEGFDSIGETFDPQKHEAIQQVESSEHDTNTVLDQFQKGYFLHERLIRPALVSVAKKVEAADTGESSEHDGEQGSDEVESVILERIDDESGPEDGTDG